MSKKMICATKWREGGGGWVRERAVPVAVASCCCVASVRTRARTTDPGQKTCPVSGPTSCVYANAAGHGILKLLPYGLKLRPASRNAPATTTTITPGARWCPFTFCVSRVGESSWPPLYITLFTFRLRVETPWVFSALNETPHRFGDDDDDDNIYIYICHCDHPVAINPIKKGVTDLNCNAVSPNVFYDYYSFPSR